MQGRKKGTPKTGGRKAGTPNVFTRSVRESVLLTFQKLQEDPKRDLLSFAKSYPRDFYSIAAKLIPTEVSGNIKTKVQVEYTNGIAPNSYTTPGTTPGT